jgi:hypothetical protein
VLKRRNLLPKRYFKDENDIQAFFKDVPDLMIGIDQSDEAMKAIKQKFDSIEGNLFSSKADYKFLTERNVKIEQN